MALRFSFTAVKGVFSSGVWIFLCNSFSDLIYFVQFQDACPFWHPETKHTCSAISSKQTLPIVEAATGEQGVEKVDEGAFILKFFYGTQVQSY